MRRHWVKVICVMITTMFLGAGTVGAGVFPDLDAKMAAARARSAAADQRAAAEKTVIDLRYSLSRRDLDRRAEAQSAAIPVANADRGLPSPVKTAILTPFVTIGTGIMALGKDLSM